MKKRNFLYIAITIICVIAIIAGVYYQIYQNKPNKNEIKNEVNNTNNENKELDIEEIKEEFNSLFDNSFNDQDYETSFIQKLPNYEEKDVIYAAYNIKQENDNYSVNINLPVFNVKSEAGTEFNSTTQTIFADKANDILSGTENYTIYNVDYTAYLNENILSLVIKSTLKEGDSAQRIIVQTYNYNIETKQKVTLNEMLDAQGIDYKEVNKKIEKQVTEANNRAEAISEALGEIGQAIYKRDINNAMYVTDNVSYFFVGPNGQIYIIYPYGNSNFTSEMDIIKV